MKPTIRTVAQERKPLEDRRAELLAELEEINNLLGAIGRPSASNAAIRYIETNPGAKTSNIIAATGICPIQLSRMKRWGRLHNSGNPGRRGGDTQWWMVIESTNERPRKKCEAPRMTESIMDRWPDDAKEKTP